LFSVMQPLSVASATGRAPDPSAHRQARSIPREYLRQIARQANDCRQRRLLTAGMRIRLRLAGVATERVGAGIGDVRFPARLADGQIRPWRAVKAEDSDDSRPACPLAAHRRYAG